jgi:hypothetical protein
MAESFKWACCRSFVERDTSSRTDFAPGRLKANTPARPERVICGGVGRAATRAGPTGEPTARGLMKPWRGRDVHGPTAYSIEEER